METKANKTEISSESLSRIMSAAITCPRVSYGSVLIMNSMMYDFKRKEELEPTNIGQILDKIIEFYRKKKRLPRIYENFRLYIFMKSHKISEKVIKYGKKRG